MARVFDIIQSSDFNAALINLLIDLHSSNYEVYFLELDFDEAKIDDLNEEEVERLTKIAAVVEYVGNRQANAPLFNWIYSKKLKLTFPYTPGVPMESMARIRRIFSAPKEFAQRNVFYDEHTLKPV